MKSPVKGIKQNHVANTKYGMGDYYGTGVKNPMGKIEAMGKVKTPKLNKKPRSFA